jgi:hypothetical protein
VTSAVLHAAWFDDAAHAAKWATAARTRDEVSESAAFRAEGKSPEMTSLATGLKRLDVPAMVARPARAWVLTMLQSVDAALALGSYLDSSGDPALEALYESLLDQQVMFEVEDVPGVEMDDGLLAQAHQFGVIDTTTVAAQWELNRWYAHYRMREARTLPGMIRTRRYTVLAGVARFAVLYEFGSVRARLEGFEALSEARASEAAHPNAAVPTYTVHMPGAPFIGSRIP